MRDFYEWYLAAGLEVVNLNNAGDPMTDKPWAMSSHVFEREVIDYFAPLYGFDKSDVWGIVTHSGTDGNNHGIYFGANYLKNKTQLQPVVYVSDEAHYSNMRLAHLQNLEVRLIKSDMMGRMIPVTTPLLPSSPVSASSPLKVSRMPAIWAALSCKMVGQFVLTC